MGRCFAGEIGIVTVLYLEGGGHLSAFLKNLIFPLFWPGTENLRFGTEFLFSPMYVCTIACKLFFQREKGIQLGH